MDRNDQQIAERELVIAAREGSDSAFSELIDRYKHAVFATVIAVTSNLDAAPDVAQESFLRAWLGLAKLDDPDMFGPWLRAIARNRGRTWLAREQHRPKGDGMDVADLIDGDSSPVTDTEREEQRRVVMRALDGMMPGNREMLLMYYSQGLATPQIASQLQITEAAARQRLRRARTEIQNGVEAMIENVIGGETPGPDFTNGVSELIHRARALFGEMRYDSAVPVLEQARDVSTDPVISMLLAEAYSFGRSREAMHENPEAYGRALALFDEVLAADPDNTLARLRRAALRATVLPIDEVIAEQKAILEASRGGPYGAVAELELARRRLTGGQSTEALALYEKLELAYPWMSCVIQSEKGVCYVLADDAERATEEFESAVAGTTTEAMAVLKQTSAELIGANYWSFWRTVDNLPVRQCQNHAWLAGLYSNGGRADDASRCLHRSIEYLAAEEVGAAAEMLRNELLNQMQQMFPQLAEEAKELLGKK